jgi:hypothetical protein
MVVVLDESRPVARKEHTCEVCWGTIGAGDTYLRQRNIGDDGPYVFKAHRLCWALSLRIAREQELWTDEGEWPEPYEVRSALADLFGRLTLAASPEKEKP